MPGSHFASAATPLYRQCLTTAYYPHTGQTLTLEQCEALEVLGGVGLPKLAEELEPTGTVEWLACNDAAFTECTEDEIRRIADREEPADVLGSERAARLSAALDS
jgi:hypothetical protein